MSKEILGAFDRVSNICIDVVGDDCKDDLILLAGAAGISEKVLKEKHSDLYERGIVPEEKNEEEIEEEQEEKELEDN